MDYFEEQGLDNDAAIELDAGLMVSQARLDAQARGYIDFLGGRPPELPKDRDYMVGYEGASLGLVL